MFDNVFVIFGLVIVTGLIACKLFPILFPERCCAVCPRAKVYKAIDGERAYQASQWQKNGARKGHPNYRDDDKHSVTEWLMFREPYYQAAAVAADTAGEQEVALHNIRKLTALGVACLEEHGCPERVA